MDSLGNFIFIVFEILIDGIYNLEVEVKIVDGSGSVKFVIIIDFVIDKLIFEFLFESSVFGYKGLMLILMFLIVGMVEENVKVDIYVDNKLVVSVDVDKDGNWSYEFKDNELFEGENSIKVVVVDKVGNKNEMMDSIIIDIIFLEKLMIELDDSSDFGIKNDNIINSILLIFIGVVEFGFIVFIYFGFKYFGEVIVVKDGIWSYMFIMLFKDGEYNIIVIVIDIVGYILVMVNLFFIIDICISYFSVEIEMMNDSGIVGDNVINNICLIFIGKIELNVIISVINSEIGEEVIFKVNDKGEWMFNFIFDLVEGINNFMFIVEDVVGNKKDFFFSYVIDIIVFVFLMVFLEDFVVLLNGIILLGNDLLVLVGMVELKFIILLM